MTGCSTFEAWCACARIRGMACLSNWPSICYVSSRVLISLIRWSIPVEAGSIKVHGNRDIVHTSRSIGGVVLGIASSTRVELVLVSLIVIITLVIVGAIGRLESSSLLIIEALEISKHSSESRSRNKWRPIGLSSWIGLRALTKDVLQQLLSSGCLDCLFLCSRIINCLRSL